MLNFCKKILNKVSFDPRLFKKELAKSTKWLSKKDLANLKIWALTYFANYRLIIKDVFDNFS